MRKHTGYVHTGILCDKSKFFGFFRELREPLWRSKQDCGEDGISRYGTLDVSRFSELEMRMYILIKARLASMEELKSCYTLDEALKLYGLYCMDLDIERMKIAEMDEGRGRQ